MFDAHDGTVIKKRNTAAARELFGLSSLIISLSLSLHSAFDDATRISVPLTSFERLRFARNNAGSDVNWASDSQRGASRNAKCRAVDIFARNRISPLVGVTRNPVKKKPTRAFG